MKQTGRTKHPLYNRWLSMKGRCKFPSHTSWQWYGARGITVCKRWLTFENFIEDMGPLPFNDASIERKDTNGNYCPENCFWASPTQQAQNRRNSLMLTFRGITRSAGEWSELLKIDYDLICNRKRKGWSDERILTQPKRRGLLFEVENVKRTRNEWSRITNVKPGTIWWRLKHGWSIDQAVQNTRYQSQFRKPEDKQ